MDGYAAIQVNDYPLVKMPFIMAGCKPKPKVAYSHEEDTKQHKLN